MSNIYLNEPPTQGKIYLKTTFGDIDIELWSKEAPKACRNFVQLCMEGYYDNTIFHRVVKGFIAQGGDPTGTGLGGESIYGKPFRDEFHSRLRFVRRGLVAMANAGRDDNGSQFFFTLGNCPELQNKHTIFGKVTGKTLYNMLKLEDALVDRNDRPKYPHKIISTEILSNPFTDIVPRVTKEKKVEKKDEKKTEAVDSKGKKDYKLLSFGDEAEEEEEEMMEVVKEFKGKSKSSHDLLKDDPKLSAIPAVDTSVLTKPGKDEDVDSDRERKKKERLERFRRKLERKKEEKTETPKETAEEPNFDFLLDSLSEKRKLEQEKLEEVRNEFKSLKKQIANERKNKVEVVEEEKAHENPAVEAFRQEAKKYKEAAKSIPKKVDSKEREEQSLLIMEKFRSRIQQQQKQASENKEKVAPMGDKDMSWLAHEFRCQKEDEGPVLAKDANMRGEGEWYDIYDPRNPINIRRREGVLLPEEMDMMKNRQRV